MAKEVVLSIGIDSKGAVSGVKKLKRSYDDLMKSTEKTSKGLKKSKKEMDKLGNKASKTSKKIDRTSKSMKHMDKSGHGVLQMIDGMIISMGIMGAVLGTIQIGVFGTNFEDSMLRVKAVTKATEQEFKNLNDIALLMGDTTRFSALDSADALAFLGMAGINVKDSIESLPSILNLASAGNIDLATSADIASNAMTAMGISASEMNRVSDVFSSTITNSNTNMQQLAEAFKFAAPLAKVTGLSIEELSASIGILGNSGIQASLAGTGLRQAMSELLSPSKKIKKLFSDIGIDLDKNLIVSLNRMAESGIDAEQVFKSFNLRGGQTVAILLKNIDALNELTIKNKESAGEAQRLSDIMESGVGGSFRLLVSSIQSASISIFNFSKGGLSNVIDLSTGMIKAFKEIGIFINSEFNGIGTSFTDIFGQLSFFALEAFRVILKSFVIMTNGFDLPMKMIRVAWNKTMSFMTSLMADTVDLLARQMFNLAEISPFDSMKKKFSSYNDSLIEISRVLRIGSNSQNDFADSLINTSSETEKSFDKIDRLTEKLKKLQVVVMSKKDNGVVAQLGELGNGKLVKSALDYYNSFDLPDSNLEKDIKSFVDSLDNNDSTINKKVVLNSELNNPINDIYSNQSNIMDSFALEQLDLFKSQAEKRITLNLEADQKIKDSRIQINNEMANSFTNSITSSLESGKLSFQSFFDNIKNKALNAFVENNITSNLFGAIGKDGKRKNSGRGLSGFLANLFHNGNADNNTRNVSASTFDNAPRFHNGLQAGEIPAIIKKDESVLTPSQMKATGGKTTIIINNNSNEIATTKETQNQNGDNIIEILIGEVKRSVGEGNFNNELRMSGAF